MFFLAEYINMVTVSSACDNVVLRRMAGPVRNRLVLGCANSGWWPVMWFVAKLVICIFAFVWLRGCCLVCATTVHALGWKVLIPINLVWIIAITIVRVLRDLGYNWFAACGCRSHRRLRRVYRGIVDGDEQATTSAAGRRRRCLRGVIAPAFQLRRWTSPFPRHAHANLPWSALPSVQGKRPLSSPAVEYPAAVAEEVTQSAAPTVTEPVPPPPAGSAAADKPAPRKAVKSRRAPKGNK